MGPRPAIAIAQFRVTSLAIMHVGSECGARMVSTTRTVVLRRLTALLVCTWH